MKARKMIETERLILISWKNSDRIVFSRMNNDSEVMKYFPSPLSTGESDAFVDRIEAEFNEYGYGLFAVEIKETGEFIGYVGFHRFSFDMPFSPGWEIGWRLDKRYWHKGYATEAAQACLNFTRQHGLFNHLYSFTAAPNVPSENVMKRI